ncbi:restriction endonuclease subunit S [Arenibacter sp. F20364]|uniref:restriction endonuclease subunit S n=1 Tax=Arenibacter sp. F20364 TaxID=2926415 RepID=UPI001FF4692E|nr:restriction endonuclease subunit S [Arenibacter sp. F20364]MCK0190660.1 restriction endonuclease subunit S [Arenibacter sp. F20364]
MQKDKLLVPRLRFPMFDGEWRAKKLDSLGKYIGGGTPDSSNENLWNGNIPWISSSDIIDESIHQIIKTRFITKYAIENSATKIIPKGSVLMVSRVGIGKFAVSDEDLCTSQDFTNLITNENEFFTAYYFKARSYRFVRLSQGTSIKGFTTKDIKSAKFAYPTIPEQQKIAHFLTAIDNRIQILEKKKTLLKQYKKGTMQKIFKQEIMFKDDDGNAFPKWEKKKLGHLTYKVGKKNKENIQYPIYSINNQEGFRPQSEQFEGLDSNDRGYDIGMYKIVYEKTFAYNPARINVGSIGYSYDLNEVIISSLYVCFKTNTKLEDLYLLAYLDTDRFNKDILRYQEGGVRQYLFYENFSQIKIPLPSNQEQIKIAKFLAAIDKNIALVNKKIEQTKSFKKGLLQQMFV